MTTIGRRKSLISPQISRQLPTPTLSRLIADHPQNKPRQGRALRVHFSLDGVCFVDMLLAAGKGCYHSTRKSDTMKKARNIMPIRMS